MKETEIIKEYQRKRGLKNLESAKEKIEAFWETIMDILLENEKITFKNWGTFEVKRTKEKMFSNPRTKKVEKIPEMNKIVFKQGKALKQKLNEEI